MLIHRMTASFGKFQNSTLELKDGLNILEAPNESGKSTWCAFLLAMLYGVNSPDEEERNRYAPWTGIPMAGRMDCYALGKELTLSRSTSRPGHPMENFQAVRAGTGESVPELNGENCGELLLGVRQEAYEQSAFIRQAGLPVRQAPDLEQRIAAFAASDGAKALKHRLEKAGERLEALERQEAALQEELDHMDQWESVQPLTGDPEEAAARAEERAAALRKELEEQHVPSLNTISRLRGAVVNLRTARKLIEKAEAEQREAEQSLRDAESAADRNPYAGKTPEQAERLPPNLPPRPEVPLWLKIALGVCAAVPLSFLFLRPHWGVLLTYALVVSAGVGAVWILHQRAKSWDTMADRRRRRRKVDLRQYAVLYRAMEEARAEVFVRSTATETLRESLAANEKGILHEVHRFAPDAVTLADADSRLRNAARRWKELSAAEAAAKKAALRRDSPESVEELPADLTPPARGRDEAARDLAALQDALSAARSETERLTEQLHTPAASEEESEEQEALEQESEAIRMAMDSLSRASAALQERFYPALEQRVSEIFHILTDGQYSDIAIDRALHLSVQADDVHRDAALLSAGCADQLYLATRLAVCELVLPDIAPIVLDDALSNFDEKRCLTALRFLKETARNRQILLFTCHSREANFFAGDPEVFVRRLTDRR